MMVRPNIIRIHLFLLPLFIHASCGGMFTLLKKMQPTKTKATDIPASMEHLQQNPYHNLSICCRDSRLREFLDEGSFYNLILTNQALYKQILDHRTERVAFYLAKERPRALDLRASDFDLKGYNYEEKSIAFIKEPSIMIPLSGNYAMGLVTWRPEQSSSNDEAILIKYTYNNDGKPVFLERVMHAQENRHCFISNYECLCNTTRNALLIRSKTHKLSLMQCGYQKIIAVPPLEKGYSDATLSYRSAEQAFFVKGPSMSKHDTESWSPEYAKNPYWDMLIGSKNIIDNQYYTTMNGKKESLKRFDCIPEFQEYLYNHSPRTSQKLNNLEGKTNSEPFEIVSTKHILGTPVTDETDLWNPVAIQSLVSFFNSQIYRFRSHFTDQHIGYYNGYFCDYNGLDPDFGFGTQHIANMLIALYQGRGMGRSDYPLHKLLRYELINNAWVPIKNGTSTEINALGDKRTKASSFATWLGTPYYYDKKNRLHTEHGYETIMPLDSLSHVSFAPEHSATASPYPYNSPETLVGHVYNLAQQKADAEKVNYENRKC
jgi:hypothetical protein